MGNCPSGFKRASQGFTCRVECPTGFVYTVVDGDDRCAYEKDTSLFVSLTKLSGLFRATDPVPQSYPDEISRVLAAVRGLQTQIDEANQTAEALQSARTESQSWASHFASLEGQQAAAEDIKTATLAVQATSNSLRRTRPPTAPANDLEKERREISFELRQNMLLVQIALFLLVVSMISYLILPTGWAQGITFLLLCVGIATAFFLRR